MKRRLLAWILVIAMGISCVPLQVFALEDSGEPEPVLTEPEAAEVAEEATEAATEATQTATEEPLLLEQAEAAESTEEVLLLEETAVGDEEIPAEGVTIVLSGYCGDNMAYALDSEGVLTISGSGSMNDYGKDKISVNGVYVTNAPWRNEYLNINKIVIKGSVEEIGNYAFYSCYPIEELDLSGNTGLKSIGDYAFDTAVTGIDGIKTLNLPNTVSYIGFGAFGSRNHLTSVTIEENPDPEFTCTINNGAFAYCDKLENVQLSNNVTSIGGICFLECPLKSITLPENLTYLGYKAFGDTSITDITIPASLNSCGYATSTYDGPFAKCTTLTSAAIEDGATTIPAYLFSNAENLTNVTIPETVTSIGTKAFYGCTALKSIYIPASVKQIAASFFGSGVSKVYYGGTQSQWGAVTVDAINGLPTPQFSHTHSYTTETTNAAGETVYVCECGCYTTELPASGENSGSCGANVTYSLSADGVFTISGSGPMTDYDYEINGGIQPLVPWASRMQDIKSVVVTGTVENIGAYSFYEAENLTTLNLSGNRNLRSIGESAFHGCALNALSLPNTLTSIGDDAFSGCYDLAISLRLPGSVSSIGDNAFARTGITSVTMLNNTTSGVTIGNMAFYACESLTDVTLSDNVTHLGNGVFGYTSVADLTIPASVTSCGTDYEGHGPLADNRNLKSVTIAEGATAIPENLFAYAQLEYVNIPESVTSFGANSFCSASLQSIYIPAATKTIADCGFSDLAQAYYGGTQSQWNAVTVDAANALPTPQFSHTHSYTKAVTNNAGQTIYACTCGGYQYEQQLPPTAQYNTITASNITLTADSTKAQTVSLNASAKGGATLSYQSNNASVTVTTAGVVTVAAGFSGNAKITITAAATTEYLETTKVVTVTVNPAPSTETDAEIVVDSLLALTGQEITVPVRITKNPGIAGFGLTVGFDSSVLTLNSITPGSVISGTGMFSVAVNGVSTTWYAGDNVTDTGVLMELNFTVSETAAEGKTTVSVFFNDNDDSNLSDVYGTVLSASFTAGQIDVSQGVLGDVSGDGKIAINDVVMLNSSLLGKVTLSERARKLGDVTGDGKIAINDVVRLNSYLLKKVTDLRPSATAADTASSLIPDSAAQTASVTATIGVGSVRGTAGQTLTVPVSISDNPGIGGFFLTVDYDTEAMTLDAIEAGELLRGVGMFSTNGGLVSWYNAENLTLNGELMLLRFTLKDTIQAGTHPVTLSLVDGEECNLSDFQGIAVPGTFTAGAIVVPGPNTIKAENITVTGSNEQSITVPLNATALGGAALSYQSNNASVTVSDAGVVTVAKGFIGTATITITAAATTEYLETTKDITITVNPAPVVNADAEIVVDSVKALAGQEIIVPVRITKNPGIAAFSLKISYDAEVLTLNSISKGELIRDNGTFTPNVGSGIANWHTIDGNLTSEGELLKLHFTVAENIECNTSVRMALKDDLPKSLTDENTNPVSVSFTEGQINVSKGALGDVDGDSYVTIADVLMLDQAAAELVTLSQDAAKLGDVDSDGYITIGDVLMLDQYVAELIPSLTVAAEEMNDTADAAAPASISVDTKTAKAGETVTVPVRIAGNPGIAAFSLRISYDSDTLELSNILDGELIQGIGTSTFNVSSGLANWHTIGGDLTRDGELFKLSFIVKDTASAGTTPVSVKLKGDLPVSLSNSNRQAVPVVFTAGGVKVPKISTITYDANGGTGAPAPTTKEEDTDVRISYTKPTRTGYRFLGWASTANATEAEYQPGDLYTQDEDVTLYAIWEYVPAGITIENVPVTLISGQSVTLEAYAYPDSSTKITFQLKDSTDSKYLTISGSRLTAKNVTQKVDVTVVASAQNVPSEEFTVTILPKASKVGIYLNEKLVTNMTVPVDIGEEYIFLDAVVSPDGAAEDVTWKSSKPSIAEVDEEFGMVTFHTTGKVTITATATDGSKKSAKVTLNIVEAASSLEILGAPETIQGGKGAILKTDIASDRTVDQNVTWEIDSDSSAFASIKAGKLTTKAVFEPVDILVTAYATANPEALDTALITIQPTAVSVAIADEDDNVTDKTTVLPLEIYDFLELTGSAYPEDSYGTPTWKSSNTRIATVDDGGFVTGVSAGVATITYSFGGKSASVKVRVGNPVTELTITGPDDNTLRSGKSMTLKAEVDPYASYKAVTWRLENPADAAYCSVSGGRVKANTVYAAHEVCIVAEAADGFGVSDTYTVDILPKTDNFLTIEVRRESGSDVEFEVLNNKTVLMEPNETMFASTWTDEFYITDAVWKSSNPTVASVDDGNITANRVGTAKITATTSDGRSATFTVKVAAKVKTITVGVKNNLPAMLMSGKSLNMTAVTNVDAANKKVTWSLEYPNNDPKCATISSSGALKAVAGLTRQTEVNVVATAADGSGTRSEAFTVKLYPAATGVNISIGDRVVNGLTIVTSEKEPVLTAKVFPSAAYPSVTWKSSSTKIATVDANGKVTFLNSGTVTITATAADGSKKAASFKLTYAPGK